jgi:hypothetical protein
MLGLNHVSVPNMMSGLVLSIMLLTRCCFVLIDWKLTLRILKGLVNADIRDFLRIGVVEAYFLDNQAFVEGQVRCNH